MWVKVLYRNLCPSWRVYDGAVVPTAPSYIYPSKKGREGSKRGRKKTVECFRDAMFESDGRNDADGEDY